MTIEHLETQRASSPEIARSLRNPGTILQGDARTVLKVLPDECVQCIVTSPPYWGVRDYRVKGEIGLENSLDAYLQQLTMVFSQAHRVLKKDGVMWVNVGDVYASGNRKYSTRRQISTTGIGQTP